MRAVKHRLMWLYNSSTAQQLTFAQLMNKEHSFLMHGHTFSRDLTDTAELWETCFWEPVFLSWKVIEIEHAKCPTYLQSFTTHPLMSLFRK